MILDQHGNPIQIHQAEPSPLNEIAWADPFHLFPNQIHQYNPNLLVRRKGLWIFDQIRRDDQVKAALSFKKHALISTGWQIQSPEGKPDDWEPTVFVEEQLRDLEGTFKESLIQILTALDYGFSVTEKIFEFSDGKSDLVALKTRSPHSFEFDADVYGNIKPDGVVQLNRQDDPIARMPREKFVLLQYQQEFGNPYGISDLDSTYKPWWGKDNAYKWMLMLLERHGVPPIFALYNSARYKGSSLTDLRNIISALQAATYGTIPRGTKDDLELWSPELAGQVSSVFVPAMKMFNEDIARSILMPGLMGLTPEQGSGSLARARVIFDVFILVVEYLRSIIEERVVNEQIVKPLVALNFPVDEFPIFKFNPITEASRIDLLKAWGELIGASAVVNTKDDEDFIRSLLEFPEREDDEEEPDGEPEDTDGPDGEQEDDEDGTEEPEIGEPAAFQEATGAPIQRPETPAEKRIDSGRIDKELDGLQARAVETLTTTLKAVEKTTINRIRKSGPSVSAPKIMPAQKAKILSSIQALVSGSARSGRQSLRRELPKRFQEPASATPQDAVDFLEQKSLWITDVLTERVLEESRQAMLKSIEVGDTTQDAIGRLREVLVKYTGSGQISREGQLLKPSRIETIVRTNTTDAFNQGRLTEIMRPELDGFVDFVQYSAIRDTRTTPICRLLDGRIFARDDPELQNFKPPNHFNCRSILVPITPDMEVDEKKIVTPKVSGQAEELKGEGFTE